jgi:hypothetical protein
MPARERCPWCGSQKFWTLASGRRRCAQCRRDWSRQRWPLRLDRREWKAVLTWYARGLPSHAIAMETGLERKRVLRALTIARTALATALAHVSPLPRRPQSTAFVPAERASATIGVRFRMGHPTAEVIAGADGRVVARELRKRVPHLGDAEILLRPFAAIVVSGRLRYVTPEDPHPPHGHAELGAFWHFLAQQLAGKGGIRAERLGLYLAEYSWRYRWRKWPLSQRVTTLLDLIDPRVPVSALELWGGVEHSDAERERKGPAA